MRPRLGLLGYGWIARKRFASPAMAERAMIAGVADPDEAALESARQLVPEAALCHSLEKLLLLPLDGVVVSTPTAFHANQCLTILRHGLPVFCQKPLGRTAPETRRVVSEAISADRLLATDFCYRHTAAARRMKQIVHTGILGKLFAFDLCFHNSYGPDKPWYYRFELSGGGCALDLGIHLIDLALWFLDFPMVSRVTAELYAGGELLSGKKQVEDYVTMSFTAGNQIHVGIACSWGHSTGGDAFIDATLRGTEGAVRFQNVEGSFYDLKAELLSAKGKRTLVSPPDDWEGRAMAAWVDRLARDNTFDNSALEVVRVAEIMDAVYLEQSSAFLGSAKVSAGHNE